MSHRAGEIIGGCASLAALLEVSAYPKPGNVHRTRDFPGTMYEHFLSGSVSLNASMRGLASKAQKTSENQNWQDLGLGETILCSVKDMMSWQGGGNVHLGVILLFSPIAAASGAVMKNDRVKLKELRPVLKKIIDSATPEDTVNIYKAISIAMSEENLGKIKELDVKDSSSQARIIEEELTPREVFSKCKERDDICSEWVTDFDITFNEGYKMLQKRLKEGVTINEATLDTFLKILSDHPDSLIQRKKGLDEAKKISEKVGKIVQMGGASSEKGLDMIRQLDNEMSKEQGTLNPGTTADITATSVFLLLLTGWRP